MTETLKNAESPEQSQKDLNATEPDLKSIRESKGFTLMDIFERTRISMANLEAIENGEFHLLPPPVFTKSFIKIYAKILGVESSPIISRYEQYLETLKSSQKDLVEKEKSPQQARVNYKSFLWGFFILIVAGLVALTLSSHKSDIDILKNQIGEPVQKTVSLKPADEIKSEVKSETADQLPAAPQAQSPANVKESKPAVQQDKASQDTNKQKRKIAGTYQIVMEAKELTWLRIAADEEPPYEVLLQPGEKIERAGSHFLIDVGNAGGIDIEFQGKSLGDLGKRGEVVHLKLP
ncbi:MAG TPA: RodZ domain-containing protein [Syntrophales bacterium]|nr:RodZ domain-containing protein [Syntrophales bacterium]